MKKCAVLHTCGERKRGKLFSNGIKSLKLSPKSTQRQGRRAVKGDNSAMKSTDELHSAIRASETPALLAGAEFARPELSSTLSRLLEERGWRAADAIRACYLERSYGYQMFNGTRPPTRNFLLRLALALELFSVAAIQVDDRALDVSSVSGDYFNDYAEVTFTLSWQDDRETGPVEGALAQYYDITVDVNKKE